LSVGPRVLLGVTGSVATIKLLDLLDEFTKFSTVIVVATKNAQHFFKIDDVRARGVCVFTDADEYTLWQQRGDPVLHVELRRWSDIFLVAPLSANTLAKLANGLCDNLLTSVARAWDFKKPLVVAPAMNTLMWEHPFTAKHLSILQHELGVHVIFPITKTLVCGDTGSGAMADTQTIVRIVKQLTGNDIPQMSK
jgi:phosphopantothenoylcysteine decarboxylase